MQVFRGHQFRNDIFITAFQGDKLTDMGSELTVLEYTEVVKKIG